MTRLRQKLKQTFNIKFFSVNYQHQIWIESVGCNIPNKGIFRKRSLESY